MTFGLAPIYEILKNEKQEKDRLYDLLIIPIGTDVYSLKLANKIRDYGKNVIIEMKKKVNKSLDWANRNNVPYVIVLGQDEIDSGVIKIKDMNNSSDIVVNIDDIDTIVKNIR